MIKKMLSYQNFAVLAVIAIAGVLVAQTYEPGHYLAGAAVAEVSYGDCISGYCDTFDNKYCYDNSWVEFDLDSSRGMDGYCHFCGGLDAECNFQA